MDKRILVLTNSTDDEHTTSVIHQLQKLGANPFRMDTDRILKGESEIVFLADKSTLGFTIKNESGELNSLDVDAVWYRRPNTYKVAVSDPIQKNFADREYRSFLDGLWYTLPNAFWLNDPHSLERARKKLLQLHIARQLGLTIPNTIVTNSPQDVRKFYQANNGRVIFKTIDQCFLDYGDKAFTVPTAEVTDELLGKLDMIRVLPSMFQERIEKRADVRATVVGSQFFVVKIFPKKPDEYILDWRPPAVFEKLIHEPIELPEHITQKCFRMMDELGLLYGAFDFGILENGEYVFFEVNPNGQWYLFFISAIIFL